MTNKTIKKMNIMAKRLYILIALVCCLTCVHAADTNRGVTYQYWVDSNFDAKTTKILGDGDDVVTIPEEYFSGLSNGLHTFYVRVKDSQGKWGRISSRSFYFYDYGVKDDSTTTALKAYRYAINDGVVRTKNITPSQTMEDNFVANIPGLDNQPINIINTYFYVNNPEEGKVTMNRTETFNILLQCQNEAQIWSNPSSSSFAVSQSLTKDVMEVAVGSTVDIPVKPIGGTFEAVKFDIPATDDYSIRTNEGCEMRIISSDGYTHSYITNPSDLVESYRANFTDGTYYAVICNSLKNLDNPSDGLSLTLQSICKKPVITQAYDGSYKISITTETEGANIYYTTDGSNPTEQSLLYGGEFVAPHNGKIKAIAVKYGYGISYE